MGIQETSTACGCEGAQAAMSKAPRDVSSRQYRGRWHRAPQRFQGRPAPGVGYLLRNEIADYRYFKQQQQVRVLGPLGQVVDKPIVRADVGRLRTKVRDPGALVAEDHPSDLVAAFQIQGPRCRGHPQHQQALHAV